MTLAQKLNPLRWLKKHLWKLISLSFVLVASYLFYLDATIQHHFSGNKWQVPAQIYARPMTLSLKEEITSKEIIEELELLGYRRVSRADSTGEYSYVNGAFTIHRRAFHFPDGFQSEQILVLQLKNGRVFSVRNATAKVALDEFRLEPWLVTRLVSVGREDRMLVNLDEVPQNLVDALVLVEDRDFYKHHGVAPLAILRALIANISAGKAVQGGSTLTQQLIKNLFLTNEKSISRKVKEAIMALLIDARYSKDEILEAYINEVFLGQNGATGVHGFGLASYFYFDRPLQELNLNEVATLVGMIKGPSYYNPRRFQERTMARRDVVLRLLFEANHIDRNTYQRIVGEPIHVASGATLAKGKHPAFMDKVQRELRQVLSNPDIRQSGVKVFTSMDSNAQRKAEKSVSQGLLALEKGRGLAKLQSAMVITEIDSGEIRAIVGDRHTQYKGFNRALDAKRSIGSLVKPAVYLTALEQAERYTLATPLQDVPVDLEGEKGERWQPQNYDKTFKGQVTLLTALSQSLNVPTVTLGLQLGLANVAQTLHRMGIESRIPEYPALTLGALDLSPLQVNQMYQTLANSGLQHKLHTVNAILAKDNRLLWQFDQPGQQRFAPNVVYLINYALHKVTLEGTAQQIRSKFPDVNMAGKTGTTDDYRDSWFSGFDKNMLITTWIGDDNNQSTKLTGASGALQLFLDYQSRQEPKSLVRRFPRDLAIAHFNIENGKPTEPGCQQSLSVPAITSALPKRLQKCATKNPKVEERKTFWEKLFGL